MEGLENLNVKDQLNLELFVVEKNSKSKKENKK